jgi:hypothetical protein
MTVRPSQSTPDRQDVAAKWRDLAHYAAAAIDMALDSSAREANGILVECVTLLDGAIDELDRPGRAA